MNRNQNYKEANKKGLITAYYLSRFDQIAYKRFGYNKGKISQGSIHKRLSRMLGMKPNSYLKRMRDRYDTLFSIRKGYFQKKLSPRELEIAEKFQDLNESDLYRIVNNMLNNVDYYDEKFSTIIDQRSIKGTKNFSGSANPALRMQTGKKGEEHFKTEFHKTSEPVPGILEDTRENLCGYDFKITINDDTYYIEVKSLSEKDGDVGFTNKEWEVARKKTDKYFLCIVRNVNSETEDIKMDFIRDPYNHLKADETIFQTIQIKYNIKNRDIKSYLEE